MITLRSAMLLVATGVAILGAAQVPAAPITVRTTLQAGWPSIVDVHGGYFRR